MRSPSHLRWRNWLRKFGLHEPLLLAVAGIVAASLWLFLAISDEVLEREPHALENRVMLALRVPGDPGHLIGPHWVQSASIAITALGSASVLTLITLLVLGYLFMERKFGAAALIIVATASGSALSQWLKTYFHRDRPTIVPHLADFGNASYPSGHSMLSVVVYLTLAVIIAETLPTRRAQIYVVGTALLIAFLVGISRVAVGVHYPSDVLAGWTAGTAWALLCWLVAVWLKRRGRLGKKFLSPPASKTP